MIFPISKFILPFIGIKIETYVIAITKLENNKKNHRIIKILKKGMILNDNNFWNKTSLTCKPYVYEYTVL